MHGGKIYEQLQPVQMTVAETFNCSVSTLAIAVPSLCAVKVSISPQILLAY